jgi:hypothetical protein
MRKAQDLLLVRLHIGVERNEDFREGDAVGAQCQPWPHRPRRVVLVADHELQHIGKILLRWSSCHSALRAFNLQSPKR